MSEFSVGTGPNDFAPLWAEVANRMRAHLVAGRAHLLTEDTLRFTTIAVLEDMGVVPERLAIEHLLPDRGKIDLVIDTPPSVAIEFKYPRDSRTGISPDTMTTGEMLKDFYRLGDHPEIPGRWCVLLLNDRLRRHLERRADCVWSFSPGTTLRFHPDGHQRLPKTARGQLMGWAETTVEARCEAAHEVRGLTLVAFRVGGQSF